MKKSLNALEIIRIPLQSQKMKFNDELKPKLDPLTRIKRGTNDVMHVYVHVYGNVIECNAHRHCQRLQNIVPKIDPSGNMSLILYVVLIFLRSVRILSISLIFSPSLLLSFLTTTNNDMELQINASAFNTSSTLYCR